MPGAPPSQLTPLKLFNHAFPAIIIRLLRDAPPVAKVGERLTIDRAAWGSCMVGV